MESKYKIGDKVKITRNNIWFDKGSIGQLIGYDNGYWVCSVGDLEVELYESHFVHSTCEGSAQEIRDMLPNQSDGFLSKFDEQNANEYYGGKNNPYEAIKIINNLDLNFNRGNVLKYILRAGKKDANKEIQDLQKAKHYIDYEIERLKIGE